MIKDVELVKQILDDIEKEIVSMKAIWDFLEKPPYNDFEQSIWAAGMRNAKEIIRKHMNNISNVNVEEKRLIDANVLDKEVMNFFLTITGNPHQAAVVRECKKSFRRMKDEQPTIYANDDGGWILCSKRMPEEHDSTFAIYKDTHLWSDAMFEKKSDVVNVTIELKDGIRKTMSSYTIDGKWKCEKNSVVKMRVIAWQPLPEPWRGKEK